MLPAHQVTELKAVRPFSSNVGGIEYAAIPLRFACLMIPMLLVTIRYASGDFVLSKVRAVTTWLLKFAAPRISRPSSLVDFGQTKTMTRSEMNATTINAAPLE